MNSVGVRFCKGTWCVRLEPCLSPSLFSRSPDCSPCSEFPIKWLHAPRRPCSWSFLALSAGASKATETIRDASCLEAPDSWCTCKDCGWFRSRHSCSKHRPLSVSRIGYTAKPVVRGDVWTLAARASCTSEFPHRWSVTSSETSRGTFHSWCKSSPTDHLVSYFYLFL